MLRTAQYLARLLAEPRSGLPEKLVFHALVSGFDVGTPSTAPSAFFTYFYAPEVRQQVKIKFVGLNAPPLIRSGDDPENVLGVQDAFKHRRDIDIIITSAACLVDPHGMLRRCCNLDYIPEPDRRAMLAYLENDHVVGDMLWLPLAEAGPIPPTRYPYRPLTVVDLELIPELIDRGTSVLLTLGVCGKPGCQQPKTEILRTILTQKRQLVTDLVTCGPTGRGLFTDEGVSEDGAREVPNDA